MDDVLRGYDARPGGFETIDLAGDLLAIVLQLRGASEAVPVALQAEVFAFDLNPNHPTESFTWKTYYGPQQSYGGVEYPALADITAEVIDYWAVRARAAVHPVLRHRYADVA